MAIGEIPTIMANSVVGVDHPSPPGALVAAMTAVTFFTILIKLFLFYFILFYFTTVKPF
jgi:hypothetical protein